MDPVILDLENNYCYLLCHVFVLFCFSNPTVLYEEKCPPVCMSSSDVAAVVCVLLFKEVLLKPTVALVCTRSGTGLSKSVFFLGTGFKSLCQDK